MAILVTGGTGYVGRAVVRELGALGEELVLLARPGADVAGLPGRVVAGDVSDLDDVATAMVGCHTVVHMAAMITMWHRDPRRFHDVNVGGIQNVVRAASYQAIDRIVYTSSILALGATDGSIGDEEREPRASVPGNPYLASKAAGLAYAREQISEGAPITVVYPGIVYGPGPRREAGIMMQMLSDLLGGKLPALVGPGDRRWCHAFTLDVARGHRLALERGVPGRGYVLGGENRTLEQWIAIAARLAGARPPRLRIPYALARLLAAGELQIARLRGRTPKLTPDVVEVLRREWAFTSARAEHELGYTAMPLEEGIRLAIEHLRAPAPGELRLMPRARVAAALVLLFAVTVALRLRTADEPLERDLTTYAVIAHEWLGGRSLYADLWDHKPPAIHLTYAAAERLAGYGQRSVLLLDLLGEGLALLGVFAAASAGGRGPWTGLLAAALWSVVSGDLRLQGNQPNTELFLNVCVVWATALLLRRRWDRLDWRAAAAVGLLLTLATLYKTVAAFPAVALVLAHVVAEPAAEGGRRRAVQQAAVMASMAAAGWAAVLALFAARGSLAAFAGAVFAFNRDYGGSLARNALRAFYPPRLLPWSMAAVLPLVALAPVGLALAWRRPPGRGTVILLALAAGTLAAVALPGRFYPHYYLLWLPLLAIGAAWTIRILGRLAGASVARLVAAGTLVLLGCLQYPGLRLDGDGWSRAKYGAIFVDTRAAAAVIDRLLLPGETFYEWGSETGLYYDSRRPPVPGLFYALPLLAPSTERPALTARVLAEIEARPPELLVVNRTPELLQGHAVPDWFHARYDPIATGGGLPEGSPFALFARRGGALAARLAGQPPAGQPTAGQPPAAGGVR